jgi:phage terminase large subunit GpA-like protein
MGKTEGQLDVIGQRFDQQPTPTIFIGPNKDFLRDEIEPRVMAMIDQAASLRDKLSRGKRNRMFRKVIGGVPFRLVWAGSKTQLSGTGAGLVLIDELDRMVSDVGGEGNPLILARARGHTFRDRKYGVTSTPLKGVVDVERCETSGLYFWKRMPPEDIESPIWQLYQSGTMYHWAWPCPQCDEYFIPRFRDLRWPEGATPAVARREAYVECPCCGGVVLDQHKRAMNVRGRYVAPGQHVSTDGVVHGDVPDTNVLTFWVSGLASPFVSFGERAAEYLEAKAAGDQTKIQGVTNTGFGELYAPGGGDVPEWHEVAALKQPYKSMQPPPGVRVLTLAVDVQTNRLVYTIRGWGAYATSWLIEAGEIHGRTTDQEVWDKLALLVTRPIGGHTIRLAFVDSGFRPGKPYSLPTNRVYQFCRRFPRRVYPTKGRATQDKPIVLGKPDVNRRAEVSRYGLDLLWLDTDWCKSWVHERIRWPADAPGAWYLPDDTTDDYCKQIVSEARVKKPTGQPEWVARSRNNHFLDCEGMQAAIAHQLRVDLLRDEPVEPVAVKPDEPKRSRRPPPATTPAAPIVVPSPAPSAPAAQTNRAARLAALGQRMMRG